MDFDKFIILREPLWRVQLADQRYLGRVYLILERQAEIDWLDLTNEELLALRDLGRRVRASLDCLFKPDMFNHMTLRNAWHQQHWHFVPRYREQREFMGHTFIDPRWGRNPCGPEPDLDLSEPVLFSIRDAIRAELLK